ncbi:MAG: carboxypeptidase regulatory-like domain-containing protein [Myxococcus sp.]|nr:carboxypeptidase regulatory-like domain-containing protein [Myxococcus sp.]
MVLRRLAVLLLLAGCGLEPLSREQLFGLPSALPKVRLTGTASNATSGAVLAGVTVNVATVTTTSDAQGAFTLEGLALGEFDGSAVLLGFERKDFKVTLVEGTNRLDVALSPIPCGGCAAGLWCEPSSMRCVERSRVSLNVVDDCTGAALTARVVIQGSATCTKEGRGFAELLDLTPGGPQTLAVGKQHYQAANVMVTLAPGFNALPTVRLRPVGDCAVMPVDVPCTCTTADCQ